MSRPTDHDPEVLTREIEALGEQVKLLTRTEQRLHRSQAELDRQLSRIEALAEFSFRSARAEESLEVARRALALMADVFDIDGGYSVTLEHAGVAGLDVCGLAHSSVAPEVVLDLVRRAQGVRILDLTGDDPDGLASELMTRLSIPDATAAVLVALRDAEGELLGGLLAWKEGTRSSTYREGLLAAHDAFLFALASHAARAIESVTLTNALRARTGELTAANARLRQSLEDLESTQAALLESQKLEAVGRLAGGVAHDFNNLMTVILGQVELMSEDLPEPPSPEALNAVRAAVDKASELTAQLLAFGRKQPHRPVPTDLPTAVLNTMKAIGPILREDIAVSIEATTSLPRVVLDRSQLDQILLNLVLNARDAMPTGGLLKIASRRATSEDLEIAGLESSATPSRFVALIVSDTGKGMTPDVLERVFEPFYTTKELGQGSGLGLASVYGLVRQNHGFIGVRSEEGSGSEFVALFPVASVTTLTAAPPRLGAARVLVVEDDDGIRSLTARVLQGAGYEVVIARDGVEALSVIRESDRVDLVVSDVIMPRMGGAPLLEEVRTRWPDLPVVFVSGHPFEQLDMPRLLEGRDQYLAKPFSPRVLRAAVERGLVWGTKAPTR